MSTALARPASFVVLFLTLSIAPHPARSFNGTPFFVSDSIRVAPEPVRALEPAEICVELVNPTLVAFDVVLRTSVAHLAIGAAYTTVRESPVHLPASSTVRECVMWVPPDAGPWSFEARVIRTGFGDVVSERNLVFREELLPRLDHGIPIVVRNPTASPITVSLGLIPHLAAWGLALSPDVIANLAPGATQVSVLTVTPPSVVPAGTTAVTDVVAYVGPELLGGIRLLHRSASVCDGTRLDVAPLLLPVNTAASHEERGAYVTALGGVHLCALGMEVDLQVPQWVTARVYEASGDQRGALLYENSALAEQWGHVVHSVPMDFELEACRDYDLAFEFGAAFDFDWFDERTGTGPYDLGGLVRVRDGEVAGNAANFALPRLSIVGRPVGDSELFELASAGTLWSSRPDEASERGVFVRPHHTLSVAALGWWGAPNQLPAQVHAHVYESSNRTRGVLLARGSATITSSGLVMHEIPLAVVLEEGKEYDLAIKGPAAGWSYVDESQVTLPFTAFDRIDVLEGEHEGDAESSMLPRLALRSAGGARGWPFSLGMSGEGYPPPFISLESNDSYGLYFTSLLRQNLTSIGWEADVQVGTVLHTALYAATGTTRGALIAEGSTVGMRGETRWHDMAVAAVLEPGADYCVEISFGAMNAWAFWDDHAGLPYTPYGAFEVFASSHAGSVGGGRLVHLRLATCNDTATSVEPAPRDGTTFSLDVPYPNPISDVVALRYRLGSGGPLSIVVYDLAGRRVATLLERVVAEGGPGVAELDLRPLAAGVYLVRMEQGERSVTRKIAVVR